MSQLHKTIKNAFLFPLLTLALLGVNSAQAELKFERTLIEDTISPDAKSYPFEFAFKNEGASVVEISEIKTTCGCTTAKLGKMLYAPGESGVVKGSFSVGDRKGLQQKSVTVLTKDLGQPSIKLSLSLEIPQLVTIKPGLILWRVGAEPEVKSLTITPNAALGARVVSVEAEDDAFSVTLKPDLGGSGTYQLEVHPISLESPTRTLIRIEVASDDADAKPNTVFAHAIVR